MSIGYPGPVLHGRPIVEPYNLGSGWVGFDFAAAFGCPVKIVNDAAMQALGSYQGGKMLFLGLGTGLGTAMIADGIVEPMELAHLPFKKGTYEDYVGRAGLERHGKKKWQRDVADVVARLIAALEPDDTVLGEATSRSSTRCRRILGQVTTAMPFEADFACGERRTLSHPPARVPNNGLEDQKGWSDDRTTRDLASAFDQQANGMAGPRTPPQDNAGLAPAKAVRR